MHWDVRARIINEQMKIAAVEAIRNLAKQPIPEEVVIAYQEAGVKHLEYGPEYIIPKPMDPRLLTYVAAAVAKAAIETKVAHLPYPEHYHII